MRVVGEITPAAFIFAVLRTPKAHVYIYVPLLIPFDILRYHPLNLVLC